MENTVVFEWKIFLNGKYSSTTYIYKNFTKVKKNTFSTKNLTTPDIDKTAKPQI